MQNKCCVSLDWLQVFCYANQPLDSVLEQQSGSSSSYTLEKLDYGSRVFSSIACIKRKVRGQVKNIGLLYWNPRSSAMRNNSVSIKLDNEVLYTCNVEDIVNDLCLVYNLSYHGITRCDICLDYTGLECGCSIKDFIKRLFLRENGIHIKRLTTANYYTVSDTLETHITGVKFGSKSSRACSYMYNKTFELLSQKYKPYIVKNWTRCGLITESQQTQLEELSLQSVLSPSQIPSDITIWRTEISIRNGADKILDTDSGEILALSPSMVAHDDSLCMLFRSYAYQYFRFIEKKDSLWHDVDILPVVRHEHRLQVYVERQKGISSTYNERRILKALESIESTFQGEQEVTLEAIHRTCEFLRDIIFYRSSIHKKLEYEILLAKNLRALKVDDYRVLYITLCQCAQKLHQVVHPKALEIASSQIYALSSFLVPADTPHKNLLNKITV